MSPFTTQQSIVGSILHVVFLDESQRHKDTIEGPGTGVARRGIMTPEGRWKLWVVVDGPLVQTEMS